MAARIPAVLRAALGDGATLGLIEFMEAERKTWSEEMLAAADKSFEQLSSVSHRAAAWVAQGDLAQKRNADREAARLYRRAAEALQDFRF